tara:strand:- start:9128 stop:9925 length:798 start_codon:yes stop_codon:yes gene_type:complete
MAFSVGAQINDYLQDNEIGLNNPNVGENTGASQLGIGENAFVFDIARETTLQANSTITDHFVEDNTALQDHIALSPLTYVLKGFIGELVFEGATAQAELLTLANEKLAIVEAYLPDLTAGVAQKISQIGNEINNTVNYIDSAIASGTDIFNLLTGADRLKSKQAQAVDKLMSLRNSRELTTLITPYKEYKNMAIESIVATQVADSRHKSDIEVRVKQIRTVDIFTVGVDLSQYTGRAKAQASEVLDKGKAQGKEVSQSAIKKLLN